MKLKGILLIALLLSLSPSWAEEMAGSGGTDEERTLIWPDGTRYVGGVQDGKRSGKGTIYWQDGTRFVGNFKNDLRNGPGTMILPDGTVYNGYFQDDKLVETPVEPAAPEVAVSEPEPVTAPEPEPVVMPEPVVAETEPMTEPEPAPAEVAVATPAAAAPPEVTPPPQQIEIPGELPVTEVNRDIRRELTSAVEGWSDAWASQDVTGYLASYSEDFDVPGRQSRSAWEALRRSRLNRPGFIDIDLEFQDFEVVEPNVVEVSFKQTYKSDVYSDVTDKVLRMRKEGDDWRILREFSR